MTEFEAQWLPSILAGMFTVAAAVFASVNATRHDQKKSLDAKFSHLESVIEERVEAQRREFGEALTAFRNKDYQLELQTRQLELYMRDHYVNKDDYKENLKEIKETMARIEGKLDARS